MTKKNITVKKKLKKMTFTGERYLPEVKGEIEIEHLHRYLLACELSKNKIILDIACGEGYGSAKLAVKAKEVIGVDISPEAIQHAKQKYNKKNLSFKIGNCSNIPLKNKSVDMIVSFETIEHHNEHDKMLKEIKRVLKKGGVLIMSSPDKLNYSEKPNYNNPFHVSELYEEQFKELISNYFKNSVFYGQRVLYGSNILSESKSTLTKVYNQEGDIIKDKQGMTNSIYWLTVASDSKIPMLPSGVLELPINLSNTVRYSAHKLKEAHNRLNKLSQIKNKYMEENKDLAKQISDINKMNAKYLSKNQNLSDLISGINKMNLKYQAENIDLEKDISDINQINTIHKINLENITSSKYYKIWRIYCSIKELIRK